MAGSSSLAVSLPGLRLGRFEFGHRPKREIQPLARLESGLRLGGTVWRKGLQTMALRLSLMPFPSVPFSAPRKRLVAEA